MAFNAATVGPFGASDDVEDVGEPMRLHRM